MAVLNESPGKAEYIVLVDSDSYQSKEYFIEHVLKIKIGNKELVTQFIQNDQNDHIIRYIVNKDDYYNQFYSKISHIIIVVTNEKQNEEASEQIFNSYTGCNKAHLKLYEYNNEEIQRIISQMLNMVIPSKTLSINQAIDRQIQKLAQQ